MRRLEFSADGQQLRATERKGQITAWDVATGKHLRRWQPLTGPSEWVKERETVIGAVPSPDGKFIAWMIWQLPDYRRLPPGIIPPPVIPRASVLVIADADTEKPLSRHVLDVAALRAFAFSADGRRFATGGNKLTLWDTTTGKKLFALDTPGGYRFALSPDGKHAVVAEGSSRVRLWDLDARKMVHEPCPGLAVIDSHTLETPQVFSADGKSLVLAGNTTLRLIDTTTGKERCAPVHRCNLCVHFAAAGQSLLTTCDETRCTWDLPPGKDPILRTREQRHAWEGICGDQALAHSADGRFFVDCRNRRTCVREVATDRVRCALEGCDGGFFGLLSRDATRGLVWHHLPNQSEVVSLFDAATGKKTGEIKPPDRAGYPTYSPDGGTIAWAEDTHDVNLYDGQTGKFLRKLHSARPLPRASSTDALLVFSPDSEFLIVGSSWGVLSANPQDEENYNTLPVRVFEVASGREVSRFHANPTKTSRAARLACGAVSPDRRLLAVAEEESGTIRLFEIASGQVRAELTGHRHGVHDLCFSLDGKLLASGGEDNLVFLWDVPGARTAKVAEATDQNLAAWWADLAAENAGRAGIALAALIHTADRSLPYLKDHLSPAKPVDPQRLARLLADLNADAFDDREAATRELTRLGERVELTLRRTLKATPPPETARRLNEILERLELLASPSPDTLRALRTIEALETVGSPEAVRHLEALARGSAEDRQTREAKAALARLSGR
jgi:WD40 repeat protein